MQSNGYASILRQYRAAERARNADFTEQALVALQLRKDTINAMDVTDEHKAKLLAAAERQWTVFMQREIPVAEPVEE